MSVKSFGESKGAAYTGTAAEIDLDMGPSVQYRLFVSTAAWFKVTTEGGPAAVAEAAGSHPLVAGEAILVGAIGSSNRISVIKATSDGRATLSVVASVA